MDSHRSIYVIRRNTESAGSCDHYVTHGEMGGMQDAIGYGSLEDARKFLSDADAQVYIDRELPTWGRSCHCPAVVEPWELGFSMMLLSNLLYQGADIPVELLEPTQNKLLIWRR